MEIIVRLDRVMADRKVKLKTLDACTGISAVRLSKIKAATSRPYAFLPWKPFRLVDANRDILEYGEH